MLIVLTVFVRKEQFC